MRCPACGHENPADANFCNACAAKIERTCPQCNKVNPPESKFCNACGQALTSPPESPLKKPLSGKRTLPSQPPQELTEKILAQRGRIEGERRQVTVMFCDLEGSTALTEKLGDEKAFALIGEIFGILTQQVHRYEGTVQEFRGDGIMALFGAPIALENAAQRAVNAALAIHQEVTKFSHRIQGENRGPGVRMRIGIHTGPVVLGTIGSDLRLEFQVIGDTVNLAARVESLAEPGTTYVTEETFQQTEGFFRFEGLGEKSVKGKETPVKVYRVISPSSQRTRFEVSAEQGLTPFLGRQRELELLLDGFERIKAGKGQAFSIISEAGLGKSRLLYEFRKAVSNEEITFLEGRCLSFGRGTPYHPFIDILKANFEIKEEEKDSEIRRKVQQGLDLIGLDQESSLPYFLELLSVKDSGFDQISLSPEGKKERVQEAFRRIVLKGSEARPLVIAIEDLHWMDQTSEEALKTILDSIPGSRTLMIFTYRPEFIPPWGGKSFHNQLTLQRLSNRKSLEMATYLLGSKEMEKSLEELLLEKAEGIPFFLEEFVRSLKDLKIIESRGNTSGLSKSVLEMTVPTTIQEVILARVDPLPAGAKEVLQTGAVIEREFSYSLIKQAVNFSESELLSCFSLLKDTELLYERGIFPQSNYIFKHALIRDVVYGSILARRRRELHGQIGTAIEEFYKDNLAEHCVILSEHFFQSEDYARAANYSRRAARKAEKSASMPDAIAHAQKRVLCLEKLPDSGNGGRELIDARAVLGLYFTEINHHVEAREAVEPVVRLTREKGYRKRLCQIQTVMGSYYGLVDEDFPKAFEALEEAFRIAGEEKDTVTLFLASFWSGNLQAFDCDFEKARSSLQRALDISSAAKSLWGIASMKAHLAYYCHFYTGRINSLIDLSSEALRIAQDSGDTMSRGQSQTTYGLACYAKGRLEDAVGNMLDGKLLCERIGLYSWAGAACSSLADTYFEMKEYHKSRECYAQAMRCWQRVHFSPSWARWANLGMARCGVMLGERDANFELLRAIPEKNRLKVAEGWTCRYLGEILLNLGDSHSGEAEQWMRKAIEADNRNGMRFHLGLDHALYAEFFKRQGDRTKAQEELGKAAEILRECGADGWVEKAEKKLAEIA